MYQYQKILKHVIDNGVSKGDRTGTGTYSIFGAQLRFNLSEGFPLLTTKKIHFKSVVYELLWFLRGETNVEYLNNNGVSIWDEWADVNGDLGPVYGAQWRSWRAASDPDQFGLIRIERVDQIKQVIETIKKDPDSRRMVISAWNVGELNKMALSPCHTMFQFYVADNKLSCQMYQRSADIFLGVPFNIASYSLLTHMVAQVCGLDVGDYIHTFGDLHLYKNHVPQANKQLSRTPRALPKLVLNKEILDIDDFKYEDIKLFGYDPYPGIKAEVAI